MADTVAPAAATDFPEPFIFVYKGPPGGVQWFMQRKDGYRRKLLTWVMIILLPLVIYYILHNLLDPRDESRVFLVQNGLLLIALALSLVCLKKECQVVAISIFFFLGTPVVQISFLFNHQTLLGFMVLHSCLSMLLATAFFDKPWELALLSIMAGSFMGIHTFLQVHTGLLPFSDALGYLAYFLVALVFAQVLFRLFLLLGRIAQEKEELVEQKERLLREVHHRIKNHMNTIYSLLSLQAKDFDQPRVQEAFEEALGRIRTMQAIYQSLYTGESQEHLSATGFLRELIGDLQRTLVLDGTIRIEQEIEAVEIPSRESLPVAIIINELLTNAIKYAFPAETAETTQTVETAVIQVKVRQIPPDRIEILVADNGKGMDHITPESYGFGLTLVEGYVHQYGGTMEIMCSGTPGTMIRISLSIPQLPSDIPG